MILIVLERLEGLSVRGANRKGIAQRQHSKKTLMFDALEWRSKVEFRPAAPVRPAVRLPWKDAHNAITLLIINAVGRLFFESDTDFLSKTQKSYGIITTNYTN